MLRLRVSWLTKQTLLGAVLACAFPIVACAHPGGAESSSQAGTGDRAGVITNPPGMGNPCRGTMAKQGHAKAEHHGMAAGHDDKGGPGLDTPGPKP